MMETAETAKPTRVGVDIGGTFTDLVLHDETRALTWTGKRLTTPEQPSRAVIEGLRRILEETGTPIGRVGSLVHGTTLITNTLLERTGARVGLLTTEGFRDTLEMGREIRYDVEDLHARPAPVLVPRHLRYGVGGRMTADGTEHAPLDEEAVVKAARALVLDHGIESLAIAFLHSYADPAHELRARELVQEAFPELLITLSCEVAPEIREYQRTSTACANAYVQPGVYAYLDGLEGELAGIGFTGRLSVILSGGGVTTVDEAKAFPVRLLESGPAAGAIAAGFLARAAGEPKVISFDMGGTTAKMCLIEDGRPDVKREFEAGRLDRFKPGSGLPLKLTVVDMIEIGSGGGSIAAVDDLGLLRVGPRSAGSVPGPVAYGRGGRQPTVTDSDLLLGYLNPDYFLGGELELSLPAVRRAVGELAEALGVDSHTAALGIQELVAENMAAATRMHLAEKGQDPRGYALMAFGGAGPVHAYALARLLKVNRVIVPMGAGVISAFGFLVAAPTVDEVRGYPTSLDRADWGRVAALYAEMEARARRLLGREGQEAECGHGIVFSRSADMRYAGQGFEIEVPLSAGVWGAGTDRADRTAEAFGDVYRRTFGRTVRDAVPEVVNWRLSARLPGAAPRLAHRPPAAEPRRRWRSIHCPGHGEVRAEVYDRYALTPGTVLRGPAVFEERDSACNVGPDCTVTVDDHLNLVVDIDRGPA